jgi:hypothetical protein
MFETDLLVARMQQRNLSKLRGKRAVCLRIIISRLDRELH